MRYAKKLLALAAVGVLSRVTLGQCTYSATVIRAPEVPPFGYPPTYGIAVNDDSVVVGYYVVVATTYAFVWSPADGFRTLAPPAAKAGAAKVNNKGHIVGSMWNPAQRGYRYAEGVWTELPPLSGPWSSATSINEEGHVVGARSIGDGPSEQSAFIWSDAEGFLDLGVMGGPGSFAQDINSSRQVVGWWGTSVHSTAHGFLWDRGEVTELGFMPGGSTSIATNLNDAGAIVGYGQRVVEEEQVTRAFHWQCGKITELEPLQGFLWSRAFDIAESGIVIGESQNRDGQSSLRRGSMWLLGATPININDLIENAGSRFVNAATAINRAGRIVTLASGSDGAVTLLLTPTKTPLGDLDGDCRVGSPDLLIVLAQWGSSNSAADLNDDGAVDFADLLIILSHWT